MHTNTIRMLAALTACALVIAACGRAPTPVDSVSLSSQLAGENEVPAVATMASGDVTATLTGSTLEISGSFEGLMSDLNVVGGSSAHIHSAPAGENGGIVEGLTVTSTDARSGTVSGTLELDADALADFEAGDFYVNIHTTGNPSGELRAQLMADAPTFGDVMHLFDAAMLPENEVHDVLSGATGMAFGLLRDDDTLTVSGTFANLESALFEVGDVGPAHIHEGVAGVNGGVVFPLDVAANDAMTAGRFGVSTTVSNAQIETLLMGGFYLNVHTEGENSGEIRGQLFPTEVTMTATLEGAQEVAIEPVVTTATGTATATTNGFSLLLDGAFGGLSSTLQNVGDVGPAHVHRGARGVNGPVQFALDVDADLDMLGGTLSADVVLSEAERADFLAGLHYVNVHTVNFPGGEIRGQLDEAVAVSANHD